MKHLKTALWPLKYVIGLFTVLTLSQQAMCSDTLGLDPIVLYEDGDSVTLIEMRFLDTISNNCAVKINNLEATVTEYAIQVDIHKGNAARYEQIAANDSRIVALQTGMISELHSKVKRMKFKAVMGACAGFAIGILIAK